MTVTRIPTADVSVEELEIRNEYLIAGIVIGAGLMLGWVWYSFRKSDRELRKDLEQSGLRMDLHEIKARLARLEINLLSPEESGSPAWQSIRQSVVGKGLDNASHTP